VALVARLLASHQVEVEVVRFLASQRVEVEVALARQAVGLVGRLVYVELDSVFKSGL